MKNIYAKSNQSKVNKVEGVKAALQIHLKVMSSVCPCRLGLPLIK